MKRIFSLLVITSFILFSCKKEQNIEIFSKKINSKTEAVKWFLGDWENISEQGDFREIWKQENDSLLKGESIVTVKGDTVFHENVGLVAKNDSLFYVVSVKGENNEKPVSFYMTESSEKKVVFENPKHDFPNKISYEKITNDSIVASISGKQNGKDASESFPMKRRK
jgi:hypothetical protein